VTNAALGISLIADPLMPGFRRGGCENLLTPVVGEVLQNILRLGGVSSISILATKLSGSGDSMLTAAFGARATIFASKASISADDADSVAIELVSPVLAMMNDIGAIDYRLASPHGIAFGPQMPICGP